MRERRILRTKEFMQLFLTTDTFDRWLLTQAELALANTWTIDGHVNRAYFAEEGGSGELPGEDFISWAEVRPVVLSLIRGKRTPLSFSFLLIPPETADKEAAGLPASLAEDGMSGADRVLRVRFQEGHVFAASAVSLKTFSLDKEPERKWDEALSRFLDDLGVGFEEL